MDITPRVAEWLLSQGWAGLIIILLLAAIVMLIRHVQELNAQVAAGHRRIDVLQDQRVAEMRELAQEVVAAIKTTEATVHTQTEIIRNLRPRR